MRIDLHVHSAEGSPCARSSREEMVKAAIKKGFQGLAFTEHDILVPLEELTRLRQKYKPFVLFSGIEIRIIHHGYDEDVLVIGLYDPLLESGNWTYEGLWDFVMERGGYMILAHPYRFRDFVGLNLDQKPPHGVEFYSKNNREEDLAKRKELAEALGASGFSLSDSHHVDELGKYGLWLDREVLGDEELIEVLKEGAFSIKKEA